MKKFALSWRCSAAAALMALQGCSADLTLPGPPVAGFAVAVIKGNAQLGTVGEALPDPVVVEVKSDAGAPIEGRRVAFVPAAASTSFDPDTAVTNSQGQALTRWVLGTTPGVYTAEARLVAGGDSVLPSVPFQATAGAGAPDTLRAIGPTNRAGSRNQPLDDSLVVATVDRFGNPVAGVEVKWDATSGSGQVSAETSRTGPDGTTGVVWTLGNRIGVQRATAKVGGVDGSPVTFTAAVLF
jgi:hypothetical protein